MSLKSEIREEREEWLQSGKSIYEFYKYQQEKSKNVVYKPLKKARYKGVELCENDIIVNNSNQYIITNFTDDAVPIVTLLSSSAHNCFDKEWEFGVDFKVLSFNIENKQINI